MNNLVNENHQKISEGLSVQQFRKRLFDQGFSVSKEHIIGIIKKRKMKEEGLVIMQKFYTEKGLRSGYIIKNEGIRIITLDIKKIFPEQKKDYLIESTKPIQPQKHSLAEIKQLHYDLATVAEYMENQQIQIEDLRNQQNMCRVSAVEDNELLKMQRKIVENRLFKKKLSWNDDSARQKEYAYLRSHLDKKLNISRVTNLNTEEHKIVRDELMEIMDWEGILY